MKTIMFATPISLVEAEKLSCFEYSIAYFDKNKKRKKLKIASADYNGIFADNDDILEASKSDAIMFLKHVPKKQIIKTNTPVLTLIINDKREIERVVNDVNYYSNISTFNGSVLEKRLK